MSITGGAGGDGGGTEEFPVVTSFAVTTCVVFDRAIRRPPTLEARSSRRSRWPTSCDVKAYVPSRAPAIVRQPLPAALQRCQRIVREIGFVPRHLPSLATRRSPSRVVPEMVGRDVFVGGTSAAPTTAVSSDVPA